MALWRRRLRHVSTRANAGPGGRPASRAKRRRPLIFRPLAHAALGFRSPISGPGQCAIPGRTPSGQSSFNQLGDPAESHPAAVGRRCRQEVRRNLACRQGFPGPGQPVSSQSCAHIFWNFEIQILQQRTRVTILYPHDQDHRQIAVEPAPSEKVTRPSTGLCRPLRWRHAGDRYRGDQGSGKYSMADRFSTRHTGHCTWSSAIA